MNVKKAIKKIVALGTGAAFMGATVLGAMAADLNDFPAPFVDNGNFNAMIVIGQAASTPDVVGAIDIATTLQYEMRQISTTALDGATTSVSVSGDSTPLQLSSDDLELGDYVGAVITSLDDTDLAALEDGEFEDEDYEQTIEFASASAGFNAGWMEPSDGVYEDEPGFYMQLADTEEIYRYVLDFKTKPESDVKTAGDDYKIDDFEDQSISLMGKAYTITKIEGDGSDGVAMTLMGGDASDVIGEGETKTYNIKDVDYEVECTYVGTESAKFRINGEVTDSLEDGETYSLDDGTEIGIREILENEADEGSADLVEFYLGADKIVLEDTNVTDSVVGEALEVGSDTYDNVKVMITGDISTTEFKWDTMEVRVSADDDYWLAAGDKLSDFIDGENEDYVFGNVDFRFEGVTEPATTLVTIAPSSEEQEYSLDFTTAGGIDYDLEFAYAIDDTHVIIGDSDQNHIFFDQDDNPLWSVRNGSNADGSKIWLSNNLTEGNYFMVSTDQDKDVRDVRFFEFADYDSSNSELDFKDLSGGETESVSISAGSDYGLMEGTWRVDGKEHEVKYNATTGNLWVNMTGSATPADGYVSLEGGAYMQFVDGGLKNITTDSFKVKFYIPEDKIDSGSGDVYNEVTFTAGATDRVVLASAAGTSALTTLLEVSDDVDVGYTKYGVKVTDDQTSDNAREIEVEVPTAQILPQAFATSGEVVSSTVEGASGSAYTIAPIAAGVAKLDTEVGSTWSSNNVIVVGGPCVNSVAASLRGNPTDCTEGFEEGKAVVQLFPQGSKVAMLVAGYSADDTRRATTVVHKYRDYAGFTGSEVQVTGTSMSDITVSNVN